MRGGMGSGAIRTGKRYRSCGHEHCGTLRAWRTRFAAAKTASISSSAVREKTKTPSRSLTSKPARGLPPLSITDEEGPSLYHTSLLQGRTFCATLTRFDEDLPPPRCMPAGALVAGAFTGRPTPSAHRPSHPSLIALSPSIEEREHATIKKRDHPQVWRESALWPGRSGSVLRGRSAGAFRKYGAGDP